MANENDVMFPKAGKSAGFALVFYIVYVTIVFIVLGIFFRIPF
jgi:hypothetical protein